MSLPESSISVAQRRRVGKSFALGSAAALLAGATAWGFRGGLPGGFSLTGFLTKKLPELTLLPISAGASFAAAVTCGLAAAWVGSVVQPRKIAWGLVTAGCLLTLTQSMLMAMHHALWEPLPAILSMLAGCLAASWRNGLPTGAAPWFKGRVSPELLEKLAGTSDLSFLSAGQRPGTVLTCRLLNEGPLRELLPAPDFLKLCEDFRSRASAVMLAHGACLDPTESTGIRAFFGLPLDSGTAADDAVKAALALEAAFMESAAMQKAELRPETATLTIAKPEAEAAKPSTQADSPASSTVSSPLMKETPPPQCGAGLATGTFTAGLTGNTYTVFGDAVELSRWLASRNADYHTRTLLDAATHLRAADVEDRPLEVLNPPEGAAMEIYHLLGITGSLPPDQLARRDAFQDAIVLLRAGHAEDALRRFADAREGLTEPDPALEQFEAQANDQARRDAAASMQSGGGFPANPGGSGASPPPPLPLPPPLFPPRRRNAIPRKLPRP